MGGFFKEYTIDGIEGWFDAQSFLNSVRENITRVLRENRGTKVYLILRHNMIREGPNGEIISPVDFHSGVYINLNGTDEDDIYNMMRDMILLRMDNFQFIMGSGCRFHSIINLKLHTVEYCIC